MNTLEKFLESKQYLNQECIEVNEMAMKNGFALNQVAVHIISNSKFEGIDKFIVLWTVLNHHWTNQNETEIVDAMEDHFFETIERWITPSNYRDEDKFILSAIGTVLSMPRKYK